MKNKYKEYTPEELKMHKSVVYYMQLADYMMEESRMLELHDELCRLLVKIAEEYPDSIAENRGNVLAFPQVRAPERYDEGSEDEVDMEYEVFVGMFSFGVDYEASTGLKGDDVFFLTLSLWYEVCKLRDLLRLKGITFHRYERDVRAAVEQARGRRQQEEKVMESIEEARDLPVHFSLAVPQGVSLCEVLEVLKAERWVDAKTREEDWVYRLTGQLPPNGYPSQEPILFRSLNQCRYIVKRLIFKDCDVPKEAWKKVTQVFTVKKGDMANVQRANKTPAGSDRVDDLLG